jgi:hypothetical protein
MKTLAAVALTVSLVVLSAPSADAKDSQWPGRHVVAKDSQWPG